MVVLLKKEMIPKRAMHKKAATLFDPNNTYEDLIITSQSNIEQGEKHECVSRIAHAAMRKLSTIGGAPSVKSYVTHYKFRSALKEVPLDERLFTF